MKKLLLLTILTAVPAFAVPTTITVRAVSRDAKVIGTHVGGARITIRDTTSGKVLAEGVQTGGTGDTKKIMSEPHTRGGVVYATEGTAAFVGTIDIDRPTVVEITAVGPLQNPQATMRSSKTMLVLPGQNITGEGVLLEIHGFIIDIQDSTPEHVKVKMTMACGCPIEPEGLWDANKYTVTAALLQGDKVVAETPLKYAGETSIFAGAFADVAPGDYTLRVVASDPASANFGMATAPVTVARARGEKR